MFLKGLHLSRKEGNMASNRITEGVGKKIVDALKSQTDVEIHTFDEAGTIVENNFEPQFVQEEQPIVADEQFDFEPDAYEEPVMEETSHFDFEPQQETFTADIPVQEPVIHAEPVMQNTMSFSQPQVNLPENLSDTEGFEIPTNVAVLKQLISKLPTGVTKQTGAQIIRQTMEALGISMRSVLQEAQGVQEGLSNSARECQATISEYKRQIGILEKQSQKYQRQYNALNDIISLFIQTNN